MTKALVCGDVHLTNYGMFNQPTEDPSIGSRLGNILQALRDFFIYGRDNNITTYVINGDFFDSRQSDNPSTLAKIQMRFFCDYYEITPKGSILYFNIGNHDELTRNVEPNALQNFAIYSKPYHDVQVIRKVSSTIEDNDDNNKYELFFIPYSEDVKSTKKDIRDYLIDQDPQIPVTVFAHLGVSGATQGRWNHRLSSAFNLEDLGWNNKNVKSIVLNHYHKRQTLKKVGSKEAYYVGDLTALNFNDVDKNGLGVSRGFDEIDLDTGEHKFIDLTKSPYNIPTFNVVNLGKDNSLTIDSLSNHDYYKIMCKSKDTYERLSKELENCDFAQNIQLLLLPQEQKVTIDVDANATDTELVSKYCDLNYPEVKDKALDYLRKAKES